MSKADVQAFPLLASLDHLVGAQQQFLGNRDAECFSRTVIYDEFKLRRPLDREITRLCSLENLVNEQRFPLLRESFAVADWKREAEG
jgi:hypothetical protein